MVNILIKKLAYDFLFLCDSSVWAFSRIGLFIHINIILFLMNLFILIGGQLLYNILVVFAIHWHESAMGVHVFPNPNPTPTTLPIPSLWVVPVHRFECPVSCIKLGLFIYFTYSNIHVSMLFSQIITPLHSPRVQRSVLYICVSFAVWHIGSSLLSF